MCSALTFFWFPLQVWSTSTCEFVRTLNGHKRGIACLQYRDRLVVSGSSDNTIRCVGDWSVLTDLRSGVQLSDWIGLDWMCDVVSWRWGGGLLGNVTVYTKRKGHLFWPRFFFCKPLIACPVLCFSRLWDIECGACLRVLEGHEELVRCIRFDNKRIVSGAYDGYERPPCLCS